MRLRGLYLHDINHSEDSQRRPSVFHGGEAAGELRKPGSARFGARWRCPCGPCVQSSSHARLCALDTPHARLSSSLHAQDAMHTAPKKRVVSLLVGRGSAALAEACNREYKYLDLTRTLYWAAFRPCCVALGGWLWLLLESMR